MATLDQATQTQIANIERDTGRSFAEWLETVRAIGLARHGEIVAMLKREHGFTHGNANLVALRALDEHGLAHDDDVVPPLPNGLTFFERLQAAGVPSELQTFEKGGHGFSLHWTKGLPCAAWPELFLAWATSRGFKGY